MKKKYILTFALLFFTLPLLAQDFEIVSVESLPADMSAREEMKTDHTDRQCALLRVATQNIAPNMREGFSFVPDLGSEVVERATRDGEIWLWVSPGIKYLRIKHRDWGQYELRLQDYVTRIEALHTYKVTIKGALSMATQEQNNDSPTQQYLVFQLSPTNAMLEVDGQLWEVAPDGTAMKFVNFGTYSYRVQAPNYLPQTGKVTVDDPINSKIESVRLKSDLVHVTFQVDADAEIWINNEKKGTRTWTGSLGKGTYKIECKQANHETTMVSQEITASTEGKTITLPTPIPIYGSLSIESTPNFAKVYIDGEETGQTPKYIPEIQIGSHEIRLSKEGNVDHFEKIVIKKDGPNEIKVTLLKPEEVSHTTAYIENYLHYKKTKNGLYYKFYHQDALAVKPEITDFLKMSMVCYLRDSLYYDWGQEIYVQLSQPFFKGDLQEAYAMMHIGDSASFYVKADSVALLYYDQDPNAAGLKPEDFFRYEVKLLEVKSEEEFMVDLERLKETMKKDSKKAMDEYIIDNNITVSPEPSGIYIVTMEKGEGRCPIKGEKVEIDFSACLLDGQMVGTTFDSPDKFSFVLGEGYTIQAWEEIIPKMHLGERVKAVIPFDMAYGEHSVGSIPAYSNLVYDIKLLKITTAAELKSENEKAMLSLKTKNEAAFLEYLKDNNITDHTASGLFYHKLLVTNGVRPQKGQTVKIKYVASYIDGTLLGDTDQLGGYFKLVVGEGKVLKGLEEGICLMRVGEKTRFVLPYTLAYGDQAYNNIPPCSNLIFDVELLEIMDK